ncbi:translation initiation factor IF-2-like [Hemicordylus capensis]|uniref:translation initiation factor IF-2-like n=1 Tax=Hemicordylus capensis TaxID=884348 RepID=UPI0023040D51|nr:translation initiation factor IF-2-like [Hemicordylus capensis]
MPSTQAPTQTPTSTMATARPSTGRSPTPTPTAAAHTFLPSTPAPARTPTIVPAIPTMATARLATGRPHPTSPAAPTTPSAAAHTFLPSTPAPARTPTALPTATPSTPPKTPAAPRERTAAARHPPATTSSRAVALLPGTPSHCPCPWLPARALGVSSGSPVSWAGWLAARCCLLRLVLYAACLLLVALPTLAGLGWLGWLHLSGSHPAWQGPLGGQWARALPLQAATSRGGQLRSSRGGGPRAVPRTYRVCRDFQVAPSRHTSWLLISLPGPARHGPWEGCRGASSAYSLDRGRDAIGAVRVKYAAATL